MKLLVILSPNEIQLFKSDYDIINNRVYNYCNKNNIMFYDPLSDFRHLESKAKLFNDGLHLSEKGHQVLADLLTNLLLNNSDRY